MEQNENSQLAAHKNAQVLLDNSAMNSVVKVSPFQQMVLE